MPAGGTIFVVALAGLAFSLSPGPSMFYVLSRSLSQGVQAGFASAFGLAVGGMALAVITALGAGVVLSDSDSLFRVVKTAGGMYLIFLGLQTVRGLRKFGTESVVSTVPQQPLAHVMRQGVLVEFLNPKTVLFFLAFLPGFIDTNSTNIGGQMLILGLLIPLTAIPADLTVSLAAGSLAERFRAEPKMGIGLEVVSAAILFGLGVRVLLSI